MTPRTCFCTLIGVIAREVLELNNPGAVTGVTSKGIFLRCGNAILFITDAPYKSPYNLYIPGYERLTTGLEIVDRFDVENGLINFPEKEIRIDFQNAEVWVPTPPEHLQTAQPDRIASISHLLQEISVIDPAKGWLFLHNSNPDLPTDLRNLINENTNRFRDAYRNNDLFTCLESAGHLLGLGGGLTPSGDDWLAGFVLYLVRFSSASSVPQPFLRELEQPLLDLASRKTTTISVNRIAAAFRGFAEEPFLQVIDTLFAGGTFPEGLPELLSRFGHSSGVDTTLGIATAITCE